MPTLKVLIKGLNKVVEFPQDTKMEVIEQSIKGGWDEIEKISGLPTDQASRMERAKYLGFNPDEKFFHGTKEDFNKFDVRTVRGGKEVPLFFTPDPEVASHFAGGTLSDGQIIPTYLKTSKTFDPKNPEHLEMIKTKVREDRFKQISDGEWQAIEKKETLDAMKELGFDSFHVSEGGFKEVFNEADRVRSEVFPDTPEGKEAGRTFLKAKMAEWDKFEGMRATKPKVIKVDGGLIVEHQGDTFISGGDRSRLKGTKNTAVFNPERIRSIHAEFDPSQQKSGNLLASASGAAVLGGLAATDDAQAATSSPASANGTQSTNLASYLMANPTRLTPQQARQIFNQQKIEAPKHPILHDIANLMRKVDTPFGPMFEATPDMLDRWAYGEGTSYFDKLMATLEVAPI